MAPVPHAEATNIQSDFREKDVQRIVPTFTETVDNGFRFLTASISLPQVDSSKQLDMDVSEVDLVISKAGETLVKTTWPHKVDDSEIQAKFKKSRHVLKIVAKCLDNVVEKKEDAQEEEKPETQEEEAKQETPAATEEEAVEDEVTVSEEDQQKYEKAKSMKEEGNALFKSSKYEEAIEKYSETLDTLPEVFAKSDIACACYNNRAACYSQTEQHKLIIRDSTSALECDSANLKARIRRAHAYEALERYEQALEDMRAVSLADPTVRQAKEALQRLPRLVRDHKAFLHEAERSRRLS